MSTPSAAPHAKDKVPGFEIAMGFGVLVFLLWQVMHWRHLTSENYIGPLALLSGMLILSGACEFLVRATEGLAARLGWDEYVGGTVAEIVSTLPEFVVIVLVVQVSPVAAFSVALVTIYNNALAFSIYSYFLPKGHEGQFVMPAPITRAGTEVLIGGSGIALVLGLVTLALRSETHKTHFSALDLIIVGSVLMAIFGFYLHTLVKYYAASDGASEDEGPRHGGEYANWKAIGTFAALGVIGAVLGGESVSHFAEVALEHFHLSDVQAAIALALFAGVSEYVIVYKAHRRKEYGIALANVFGGITQVMFLVFSFTLLVIGVFTLTGRITEGIPINFQTTALLMLLFPVFFVLFELIESDHTLDNLDATAMTSIYILILYLLLST
jgi:Ca2+/Na+ antiporter